MPDSDYRVIEETPTGWAQAVRAQVIYRDASGGFVGREQYLRERRRATSYGVHPYGTTHIE